MDWQAAVTHGLIIVLLGLIFFGIYFVFAEDDLDDE